MKRRSSLDSHRTLLLTALGLSAALTGGMIAPAAFAESPTKAPVPVVSSGHLTNLAHLNWLLDTVPLLPGVPGHSTYQQSDEPTARAPWGYADRQADGSFVHVGGGGISDAAKGYYNQGAFDADDISRSAVVYLRDWKQNGTHSSKTTAYELLRDLTYLQTDSGPNAGNVVLWQQSDGTLNPSAKPVEQPLRKLAQSLALPPTFLRKPPKDEPRARAPTYTALARYSTSCWRADRPSRQRARRIWCWPT